MRQSVLIIDDEINQAENLSKALKKRVENTDFHYVSAEEEITTAIENRYFSVAIVDLRMDKFSFDGIDCIQKIFEINPFAKVIVISAFAGEYFLQIKDLLLTGKVIDVVEKESFDAFTEKLASLIINYHQKVFDNPSEINNALIENYAQAKNEPDNYKKGERFEHFVSLLFQSIGFNNISKRVKDQSANEVDLIIRNEIDDIFIKSYPKFRIILSKKCFSIARY